MTNTIFSKDPVNNVRQVELDITKVLAIFFMVTVHIYARLGCHGIYYSKFFQFIVEFLGGPLAAPVFLLCLGAGVVYSKRPSYEYLLKRGISLLIISLLLNIFRVIIPAIIIYLISGKIWAYNDLVDSLNDLIYCFLDVDILTFSGLVFIFFAIVKKFNISLYFVFLIGIILCIIGVFIPHFSTGNVVLDLLLGRFVWMNDYTWFPSFLWLLYPIAGYLFGSFLIRCSNKDLFYKKLFSFSLIFLIVITSIFYKYNIDLTHIYTIQDDYYYKQDFLKITWILSLVFMYFSVIFFISKIIKNKLILKIFYNMSNNLFQFYCIHWVILGNTIIILSNFSNFLPLSQFSVVAGSFIVIIVSSILANYYIKFKNKYIKKL